MGNGAGTAQNQENDAAAENTSETAAPGEGKNAGPAEEKTDLKQVRYFCMPFKIDQPIHSVVK